MVSSKDVALMAGVSVSTVSRVFSNSELVNKETADRVMEAARKLNYIPNISARNLKLKKSNLLGVALNDISNSFYLTVLKEVFDICDGEYRFLVVFSSEDKQREIEAIETLISSNSACILFTPIAEVSAHLQTVLSLNHVPALQLYRRCYDDIDSLTVDDEEGAYFATFELLKAGHRDILFLDYDIEIPTGRLEGFKRAYSALGLEAPEDHFIKIKVQGDVSEPVSAVMRSTCFTAVVPVSNLLANAAISFLHTSGIQIGQDVSVIVYDDIPIARFSDISAITHPFNEISSLIVELIRNRLNCPSSPVRHEVVKPLLLRRGSVTAPIQST